MRCWSAEQRDALAHIFCQAIKEHPCGGSDSLARCRLAAVVTRAKGSSGPARGALARFGRAKPAAALLSSNPMAADDNAARLLDLQTITSVIITHPAQLSGWVDLNQRKTESVMVDSLEYATKHQQLQMKPRSNAAGLCRPSVPPLPSSRMRHASSSQKPSLAAEGADSITASPLWIEPALSQCSRNFHRRDPAH